MFPILLAAGPVTIYTYGLFLVLAFFVVSFIFWRKGKNDWHEGEDQLFDLFLLSLVWGIVASRVGFILFHFNHFGIDPLKWMDIFSSPGMIPMFGLIVAALFMYRYANKQKWNAFEILDFASSAVAGGFLVLWLGAFFDGHGFGNPTTLPWGMTFPTVFDRRHPTQLYAFIMYAGLFWFLSWAEYHYRTFAWYKAKKHSAQAGFLFATFCMAYGIFGIILGLLSPAQLVVQGVALDIPIRIAIFIAGVAILYHRSGRSFISFKRAKNSPPITPSTN